MSLCFLLYMTWNVCFAIQKNNGKDGWMRMNILSFVHSYDNKNKWIIFLFVFVVHIFFPSHYILNGNVNVNVKQNWLSVKFFSSNCLIFNYISCLELNLRKYDNKPREWMDFKLLNIQFQSPKRIRCWCRIQFGVYIKIKCLPFLFCFCYSTTHFVRTFRSFLFNK